MSQKRFAVLIDADNSQPSIIEGLLDEIASHGVASVKRIYGDWTDMRLKGWKKVLLETGMHPMQQFAYTTGKNATDSAMIIDAMDLLYTKNFDGFCIVSSDSDFTRLASRIREAGLMVVGFGEKKTPKAFMSACDKFVYTENLRKTNSPTPRQTKTTKVAKESGKVDEVLLTLLRNAVEDTADDAGWSPLNRVRQRIANKTPDFDSRSYGHPKVVSLMKSLDVFEFREGDPLSNAVGQFVRCKRTKGY